MASLPMKTHGSTPNRVTVVPVVSRGRLPKCVPTRLASQKTSTRANSDSETRRSATILTHEEWALRAWEALEFAFIRFPEQRLFSARRDKAKASFLVLYRERSVQGTSVKWLKFHCSYAFAVGAQQIELATAPYKEEIREADGCFVPELQHLFHRAMRRAAGGDKRYRLFLTDILYAKNGMPPAMNGYVKATLLDHEKAMTRSSAKLDWLDVELMKYPLALVKAEIRREVSRLFHGSIFEHSDPFPSVSSCYGTGLAVGGGFADLVRSFQVPIGIIDHEGVVDDGALVRSFQDYIDGLWLGRLPEFLDVIPVAILEPLKVRIITKGQAAEYYRCIELQKHMHTALRHHPIFEYIGRPISERSFAECFGTVESLLADEFFVSGDYKAATDNLNPELSLLCWDEICCNTRIVWDGKETTMNFTPYYLLGRKALTGHRIHYKDSVVEQTWGQLMGSPMSFPILCIINSAATHVALGLRFTKKSKIKVNGDDIGFIANPRSYEMWKSITAACGLEFSLGKNYCSREFLVMDSEIRRAPHSKAGDMFYVAGEVVGDPFDRDEPERQELRWVSGKLWKMEGFFNQSIARNLIRKGIHAGEKKDIFWTDLGPLANALLRGIRHRDQKKFLDVLLRTNAQALHELPSGCNPFFPKELGGAGIPIPAGSSIESLTNPRAKPSTLERERLRAAYLATHGSRRLEIPSLAPTNFGHVSKAVVNVRKLGPERVPRPIYERKRDLGLSDTQLLSRVIQEYKIFQYTGVLDTDASLEIREGDNVWRGNPATSQAVHQRRNMRLRRKYYEYVKGDYSCLAPMTLANIFRFEETEMLDSLWPVTSQEVPIRTLDVLGLCDPTVV